LSGAAFLFCNLVFVRRIALIVGSGSERVAILAAALTAFYFPLNNWGLRGSEVSLLTLIVSAGAWIALQSLKGRGSPVRLYLLLGVATLARPDMAVFAAAVMLALFSLSDQPADVRMKRLVAGGLTVGLFLAAQSGFRLYNYGDLLPNTYYLKVTGYPSAMRLSRGLLVALRFALETSPALLVIWFSGMLRRWRKPVAFLLIIVAGQVLYSIWVGGDAWEWWLGSHRYISIVMPQFMVMTAYGLMLWLRRSSSVAPRHLFAVAAAMLALAINAAHLSQSLLLTKPPETDDNRTMIREAILVQKLTRPQARIAVVWAGIIPYLTERPSIDLLGMNDYVIAHEPMHVPEGPERWWGFLPGHLKWDYAWSIGHLAPDVVLHVWRMNTADQTYFIRDYQAVHLDGFTWWIRRDTPNVYWDRIKSAQRAQRLPTLKGTS
jgi:arabinofuranosyltransferase